MRLYILLQTPFSTLNRHLLKFKIFGNALEWCKSIFSIATVFQNSRTEEIGTSWFIWSTRLFTLFKYQWQIVDIDLCTYECVYGNNYRNYSNHMITTIGIGLWSNMPYIHIWYGYCCRYRPVFQKIFWFILIVKN